MLNAKNKNLLTWIIGVVLVLIVIGGLSNAFGHSSMSSDYGTQSSAKAPAIPAKVIPNNNGTKIVVPAQPAPSTTGRGPLDGHSYRISAFNAVQLPASENYTVSFANGSVSAHICNTIQGPYVAAYGNMSATLMTTLMACTQPTDVMQVEQIFGTVFKGSMTYTQSGNMLTVSGNGNTIFLSESK